MTECFLLLLLKDHPEVSIRDDKPSGRMDAFGERFRQVVFDREQVDFLGFYDWLRDTSGVLVGLRLSLGTHAVEARTRFPQWDYISWESDRTFRVMLAIDRHVDENNSFEQAFGDSRLFENRLGEILLSIQADFLTPHDLRLLEQYATTTS